MRIALLAAPLLALAALPADAQVHPLLDPPASRAVAQDGVTVFLANDGDTPLSIAVPDTIDVTAADGSALTLAPAEQGTVTIAPGAFVKRRYVVAAPAVAASSRAVADGSIAPAPRETVVTEASGSSAGFLDRLRPYRPIYGLFGTGRDAAKLQFSFAARPFAEGVLHHLNFAYTQTMFWATDRDSGPIRSTTYSPELFADIDLDPRTAIGFGYAHDSNGRGAATSIDVNRFQAEATRDFDLGGGWHAAVTPRAWFYVGKMGVAPDLADYWGYTSLRASIRQTDGVKIDFFGRGNPGTGKGAGELLVSYPLTEIVPGKLGIYLLGEGFAGYGETLDDYDRNSSAVRIGIGFTR